MSLGYPEINYLYINSDGGYTRSRSSCAIGGRRVSIESNQKSKFIIIFSLLDAYIDKRYPNLEGESFKKKYEKLPCDSEFDKILKEIFRIAKVLRNTLVHKSSSFIESENSLEMEYEREDRRKNTKFSLVISYLALKRFYTAILMCVRGDVGSGAYSIGILASLYDEVVSGVSKFDDEFPEDLYKPSKLFSINPGRRVVVINPPYVSDGERVRIIFDKNDLGASGDRFDFCINHNCEDFLIPEEALGADMGIDEIGEIFKFKYDGNFPVIPRSFR